METSPKSASVRTVTRRDRTALFGSMRYSDVASIPARVRITLLSAVRSEIARLRRGPLIWLHLVLALALGGALGAYFGTTSWDSLLSCDAFFQLLGAGAPLLVGLSCGLAADAEREAGEYANLLGAPSRRRALAAKGIVLLAMGAAAAAIAAVIFCGILVAYGRSLPTTAALAQATLGIVGGSMPLYVISLAIALKWGRNASIGLGAIGLMAALASIGGLMNGLVTGKLSGAMPAGVLAFVPFAWPCKLASLCIEFAIAGAGDIANAAAQAPVILSSLTTISFACAAVTAALIAAGSALANRFEDARRQEG